MHTLIAFGFNDEAISEAIPLLAAESSVERIFWITDLVGQTLVLPANVSCIDLQDALEVSGRHITAAALSDELWQCYQDIQGQAIEMLNRVEKHGPSIDYHRRKQLFDDSFHYWLSFIQKERITAFVGGDVPHEFTDFILSELCKASELTTVAFHQVGTDMVLPLSHYTQIGQLQQPRCSELTDAEAHGLEKVVNSRIDRFTSIGKGEPIKLFYLNQAWRNKVKQDAAEKRKRRIKAKLSRVVKSAFSKKAWRYAAFLLLEKPVLRRYRAEKLNKQYHTIATDSPDLNQTYIYLGLHYQPEMTTSPLAEEFVDQYLMVRLLLASFPESVKIYIKEHPNQLGGGRIAGYYNLFPVSERIVFVDTAYSSQRLQKYCIAVATATGTVGFEGLWSGKPALVFGNAYYQEAPGALRIKNPSEGKLAASRILDGSVVISHDGLVDFMRKLQRTTLPANLNSYYRGDSSLELSKRENAALLVREVIARLVQT